MPPPPAPPRSRGGLPLVLAASALWTLPVLLTTFPPMVDYPQHLAMAAALRFWDDPARGFAASYRIAWAAPQALFEWLTAALAWVVPIATAGKLAVALAIAAVGPAALALTRRLGRPDWYALLPLAATTGYAFSWGFVGTLFAYPLFLAGLAVADRLLDGLGPGERRFGAGRWLVLAGWTLAFYLGHLQLLLVFAAAVAWLVVVRRPGWRRAAGSLSALLPGVLVVLGAVLLPNLLSPEESFSPYEQSMKAVGTRWHSPALKLLALPGLVFGSRRGYTEGVLAALALGLALVLAARRRQAAAGPEGRLFRARFALLALGLFALYFFLPERVMGYLVSERLAPLAAMLGLAVLPPPVPRRAFLAASLAAGLLALHLGLATADAIAFERDTAGLRGLLHATEPGRRLAGLVYDPYADQAGSGPLLLRYPVYTHFPALYQALRGGSLLFSYAELSHSVVRYRPGRGPDPELLARVADRRPRAFSLARDGPRFDYLLARGDWPEVRRALGPGLAGWQLRSAGRWHLLRRRATAAEPGLRAPSLAH